jgi:transposase
LVGIPVPDATQWDQVERVGDCAHPIFKYLERLAAQGEIIFQDDTPGRILTLIEENQKAGAQAKATGDAPSRTGMYTTALIVQVGERRICLYYTGRQHAGENLDALLAKREPHREKTAGDVRCVVQQQCRGNAPHPVSLFGAWAAEV